LKTQALTSTGGCDHKLRLTAQCTEHGIQLLFAEAAYSKQAKAGVERAGLLWQLAATIDEACQGDGPPFDCASRKRDLLIQMSSSVATIAQRHAIARDILPAGRSRDQMMDIELAPGRLLAALSAGPAITLQNDAANTLPSLLFLG
jgi:hypothetical protein